VCHSMSKYRTARLPFNLDTCGKKSFLVARARLLIFPPALYHLSNIMPANKLTREQTEYLIQFIHPDKLVPWSTTVNDRVLSMIYGLDLSDYRAVRKRFSDQARTTAQKLLENADFADRLNRLPFAPKSVVVGLGDSITDDHQSWLEILRELLSLRRRQDAIQVVNAGISGDTTSQLIARFESVIMRKPDWIICMAGSSDARLQGRKPTKTLVSLEETGKNLRMLRHYARTQTRARWIWMTPGTVIEEKIARHWLLGAGKMRWRNRDLAAIARVIRRQPDPVVDLQRVFGRPAKPALLMDDGIHPSLAGQKAILKALIERLTGG
jgi:acyl-CoA thioesterase-1